jgi:hypothetical protein
VGHALVGFGAAVAQDADRVDHRVEAGEQRMPRAAGAEALEVHLDHLAGTHFTRPARADRDRVAAGRQGRRGVPADEPCASQHQHSHGRPFSDFCLDRNV